MKEFLEVSKPTPIMMMITLAAVAPFVIAEGFFTVSGLIAWVISAVFGAVFLQISYWGLAHLFLWLFGHGRRSG